MARRAKRLHWIPGLFVAAFGLVIAANAVLIWFATESFSGLDTERPYEKGLLYNQAIVAAEQVAALSWTAEISTVEDEHGRQLRVRLRDRTGLPVGARSLAGVLARPTDAALDRALTFREVDDGLYESEVLAELPIGLWEVRIYEQHGTGDKWQMSARIVLK